MERLLSLARNGDVFTRSECRPVIDRGDTQRSGLRRRRRTIRQQRRVGAGPPQLETLNDRQGREGERAPEESQADQAQVTAVMAIEHAHDDSEGQQNPDQRDDSHESAP
jgi:hypothetical protein